jgi:hypothetical protein
VLFFGVAVMIASAGAGGWLCWVNRNLPVHLELAGYTWTGHLYAVLLLGAVLAGWFFLGASCIQLRLRERRERRAAVVEVPPQNRDDRRSGRPSSANHRSDSLQPAGLAG